MRCNASPTTSSAAEPPNASADAAEEREAASAFEALLASSVMKPLADGMGPLGGMLGDVFARAIVSENRPA